MQLNRHSKFIVLVGILILLVIIFVGLFTWIKHQNNKSLVPSNPVVENYKRRMAYLEKKAKDNPNDYTAIKEYANAVYALSDHQKAEEALNNLIRLQPNDANTYNILGNVYGDERKYQEAVLTYQESIKLNPSQINAYINLANLYILNLHDKNKGYQVFDKVIKNNPKNANILLMLAMIYQREGDIKKAKNTYRAILKIDKNNQVAQDALKGFK